MTANDGYAPHVSSDSDLSTQPFFVDSVCHLYYLCLSYYIIFWVKPLTPNSLPVMDNKSNGKLIAVAIGGAVLMAVSYTHLTLPTKRIV